MPPEMQSQREGGNPATLVIRKDSQHPEATPVELQAQRLRRLYAFTMSSAYAVAELAYAAGPR